jgi:hypothetical protein
MFLVAITLCAGVAAMAVQTLAQTTPAATPAEEKDDGKGKEEAEPVPSAEPSPYVEMKIQDGLSRYKTVTIPKMLRTGELEDPFEDFFQKWFFPRMTQIKNLRQLPELRDELQAFFDKAKSSPKSTEALNRLTFEMMYGIVVGVRRAQASDGRMAYVYRREDEQGKNRRYYTLDHRRLPPGAARIDSQPSPRDFHPAVKFNAMLVIANLNDKQPTRTRAAVPRLRTLKRLLVLAEHPKAPQWLRVGALIGVERHSKVSDLDAGVKGLIANAMLNILKASPSGSRDGHAWICRLAIGVLESLAIPGPQNSVVATLADVVGDTNRSLTVRAAAARAISRIQMSEPPGDAVNELGKGLGSLVLDACRYELKGGKSGAEPFSQARLSATLAAATTGLTAFESFAADAEKTRAAAIKQAIVAISTRATQPSSSDDAIKQALAPTVEALRAYLSGESTTPTDGSGTPGGSGQTPDTPEFPL